jgi:hypothetical protein
MILCSLERFCTVPDSRGTIKILTLSLFGRKWFKFSCVCLLLEKLINGKYFLIKEKFSLVSGKYFLFILGGKYFLEVVKNLKISYYLLIIINLIFKLLIAIYFVLNVFFL